MKRIFLLLMAAFAFASCQDPIDFYGDETNNLVVVNALAKEDSVFATSLYFSRFFLSNKPFEEIPNASLTLNVNGTDYTGSHQGNGNYGFNYIPHQGDSLTLTAIVPGHEPVSASTRVPKRPMAKDFESSSELHYDGYGDYYYSDYYTYEIRFKLEDPDSERNYYRLKVRYNDTCYARTYHNYNYQTDTYSDTVFDTLTNSNTRHYYTIEDMYIVDNEVIGSVINAIDGEAQGTYYGPELIFSDDKINGQTHEIKLTMDQYNTYNSYSSDPLWQHVEFEVIIEALSEEYFYYLLTTQKQLDNDEMAGIISEPTTIISNVKGGIGVLGATSCVVKPIRFQFDYENTDNR